MLTPAEITKAIADIEAAISHRPNRGISVNSNAFVLRVLKQLRDVTEERDRLIGEKPQAWIT